MGRLIVQAFQGNGLYSRPGGVTERHTVNTRAGASVAGENMARARRKQRVSKTPVAPKEPPVNPFAAQHGDYEKATVVDLDGSLGGKRMSMVKVTLNRGGHSR
jgi:hypothetical protein